MKTILIHILAVGLSLAATVANAQFGEPVRASSYLGQPITDSAGQKIGTLKDMAIDFSNGRIVEVVVAQGGFFGIGEQFRTALPQDFTVETQNKTLRFNLTREKLAGAPSVDLSKWRDSVAQPLVETTYQYYKVTPYFLVLERKAHAANAPVYRSLGAIDRAAKTIGSETVNNQNQPIGKVDDLLVDFAQGRLVEVVIGSGAYLGVPKDLSAVPPQALHPDLSRNLFTLDATQDQMFTAPHFESVAWPAIDPSQAAKVYQAWHVVPYFLPIRMETAIPIDPSVNNTKISASPEQGASVADENITAQIKKEILDSPDLSPDAKAAKVLTFNGRVTLRGFADSEREKHLVGEIAARIVPVENVDNQLIVQQTAANAAP